MEWFAIKKILIILLLVFTVCFVSQNFCKAQTSVDSPQFLDEIRKYNQEVKHGNYEVSSQNTIIQLDINNKIYYDYEVYINADGSFSLPFKTTAKLLDIETGQDRVTKVINFESPSKVKGEIDYKLQKIVFGQKIIEFKKNSPVKMIFLKKGLLEDTEDEVFIPVSVINELLESTIVPNLSEYSVTIKTSKALQALVSYEEANRANNSDPFAKTDEPDDTFTKIYYPEPQNGKFSVNSVSIDNRNQFYKNTTHQLEQMLQENNFNNSLQVKLDGLLFNGDYEISSYSRYQHTQSEHQSPFVFEGLGIKYKKLYKNKMFELGEISGLKAGNFVAANNVFGVKLQNIEEESLDIKNISGTVNTGSKINVYINDNNFTTLGTRGGYYSLKDLKSPPENIKKLRLEEIALNGETKTIFEKNYPLFASLLVKGETSKGIIAGGSGFQGRLFSNYDYGYSESKKIVCGTKYSRGLSDKLTINSVLVGDYIYSLPDRLSSVDLKQFMSTSSLSNAIYRDYSYNYGQTGFVSLDYNPNEKYKTLLDLGISHSSAKSIPDDIYKLAPYGYSLSVSEEYNLKNAGFTGKLYRYSPDYYLAGSGWGGSISDRMGFETATYCNFRGINLNGNYSRYFSNLDNKFAGGRFTFNDYNFSLALPLGDLSRLSFRLNSKTGKNDTGILTNKDYEVDFERKLSKDIDLGLQYKLNSYKTKENSNYEVNENNSIYKILSAKVGYELPFNLGKLDLTHDINTYNANGVFSANSKGFNAVRACYTFPIFHKIAMSLSYGYHYTGIDKNSDFSLSLAYLFVSGRKLELSYSYNRQMGNYFDNIFIPSSSKHYINFNLSDVFSLIGGGFSSIGKDNPDGGYLEISTYLDTNENGIKDNDEIAVSNIPVVIGGGSINAYTNKKGNFISKGIPEGCYKVGLNYDELPGLLSLSKAQKDYQYAKIEKKQKTKISFGLISSVGNITGKVRLIDEFNRNLDINDVIMSIFNDKGEEVKYTRADSEGKFSISGLSPGKYTVKLDKSIQDNYSLKQKSPDKEIIIPPVYDNYVDIKLDDIIYEQSL